MDARNGIYGRVISFMRDYLTFSTVLSGGGGVLATTTLGRYFGEYVWLAPLGGIVSLFLISAFISFVCNKFCPAYIHVKPLRGQGPTEIWRRASRFDMRQRIVSHRYVRVEDIYKKRSRAGRGENQDFEHCLIVAKQPSVIHTNHDDEESALRPFSKCAWFPYLDLETTKHNSGVDSIPCERVFFRNCRFVGIKFRLQDDVKEEICNEKKCGKWRQPLEPEMAAAFPMADEHFDTCEQDFPH